MLNNAQPHQCNMDPLSPFCLDVYYAQITKTTSLPQSYNLAQKTKHLYTQLSDHNNRPLNNQANYKKVETGNFKFVT